MQRLGIEHLSVSGLSPIEHVHLAADLGCDCISILLYGEDESHSPYNVLRHDRALRTDMLAVMRDRSVSISMGEGCLVSPGVDMRDFASNMDVMRDLGAEQLNTMSLDPDQGRALDQFAIFAEMAAERGMTSTIEFCPALPVNSLDSALAAIRHVGRADFRLLLDSMHLGRSGASPETVAALDPTLIGYVQLCDVPRQSPGMDYMTEATFERLEPGKGDMPLREYLSAMPRDVTVSLEIPMRAQAEAGVSSLDRLRPCVEAARALMA